MQNAEKTRVKLIILNFLEFAVWGSYLTSLGNFLANNGLVSQIGWFYAMQGIVSLFMPSLIGIIADRFIPAQKMLSICHIVAGLGMTAAATYCWLTPQIAFGPLFIFYSISVAFFMPTIGLNNSVAFNALNKEGLDTVADFPRIRIFGTIGFICAMLFVNFVGPAGAKFQTTYMQLYVSAAFSAIMAIYALSMPNCECSNACAGGSWVDKMGLRAFALFKQKKMAIFFIFSMMLGVSLQITNGYANPFISFFVKIDQFKDAWAAQNANALISLSQVSETLCILLIPFCLKKFGIKGVMLMSMFAWVLRFGFFGLGNPAFPGVLLFVLSCIVYGVAFDFFNVSGGLYVDKETDPSIRSSAQGLFMIMTNGLGATVGTLAAMAVNNHFVLPTDTPEMQLVGWRTFWYICAAYALVVALLFIFIFKDNGKTKTTPPPINLEKAESIDAGGMVEEA